MGRGLSQSWKCICSDRWGSPGFLYNLHLLFCFQLEEEKWGSPARWRRRGHLIYRDGVSDRSQSLSYPHLREQCQVWCPGPRGDDELGRKQFSRPGTQQPTAVRQELILPKEWPVHQVVGCLHGRPEAGGLGTSSAWGVGDSWRLTRQAVSTWPHHLLQDGIPAQQLGTVSKKTQ